MGARAGVTRRPSARCDAASRDRKLELARGRLPPPPPRGRARCRSRVKAVALNHIDVWGWRGMAFAKRKLPLVVGAEAAGEIAAVGAGVTGFKPGDPVVMYGALTCGTCQACREGRDNLCENVAGIMGFHVDGFARELRQHAGAAGRSRCRTASALRDAACAPIAFATVEHMLFDNAKLAAGRDHPGAGRRLRHRHASRSRWRRRSAAPSSPPSATTTRPRRPRRSAPITSSTTATTASRAIVRKLTGKKGVDVVFEHVGADTFNGSLLCLKRGGRLVTCGSTSGPIDRRST